jgi:multiple sugar transport system ATP-binding protein
VKTIVVYVTHNQVETMTLADRIVIMCDGYIEQVGTPDKVFARPDNLFVAGFIGSPLMNQLDVTFVAGTAGGHVCLVDGTEIPLPALPLTAGQPIVVGFRPDTLVPKGHGLFGDSVVLDWSCEITLAEPLGNETILFLSLGGKEVQLQMLNLHRLHPGDRLDFQLDLSAIHVFDKASGECLERHQEA